MGSRFRRNGVVWVVSLHLFLLVVFTGGVFAEEEQGIKEAKERDWRIYWDDGLRFRTKDNNFDIKIGGRFQLDGAVIDPDDRTKEAFPDLSGNNVEIRRARIYTSGTIYQNYGFKFQIDFAYLGSEITTDLLYKDIYIDRQNIPYLGTIRVGHQFEPFTLEDETSTKYITFMERALPSLAFDPKRNTGLLLFNTPLNERLWWGAGAFIPVEDDAPFDFGGPSGWNVSGRIAGLPWFEDKTKLLHLGFSYIHKFRSDSTQEDKELIFSARPEAHLAEAMVNTGRLISDGAGIYNAELALVLGPFSVQGEYYDARVARDTGGNLNFNGFYAYASYFITGESRPYLASEASFGRPYPKKNFDLKGGWGAWEVGLRYSYLDLNDKDIQGGEEKNFTAGLNWYLNPNVLFRFNYIFAHVEDSDAGTQFLSNGDTNIFQMRFQIAF